MPGRREDQLNRAVTAGSHERSAAGSEPRSQRNSQFDAMTCENTRLRYSACGTTVTLQIWRESHMGGTLLSRLRGGESSVITFALEGDGVWRR